MSGVKIILFQDKTGLKYHKNIYPISKPPHTLRQTWVSGPSRDPGEYGSQRQWDIEAEIGKEIGMKLPSQKLGTGRVRFLKKQQATPK